ncbi:MAG: hypothetical protein JXB15_09665 [Anaerolineales bacterium]|nr:hypothetical protein [Anaerolineales bacterium]
MRNPLALKPEHEVLTVGHVFGTPVTALGKTWLPVAQLVTWLVMAFYAGRKKPERSWLQRLGVGALTMPVVLGSEWCHNLAHVAAARLIGKPTDAVRVAWGMPLLNYWEINDLSVKPREHIARALGGPVFNVLVMLIAKIFRRQTRPDSLAHEVADLAVDVNTFLGVMSLLPMPGIDGGPVLKWSLVEAGCSVEQADRTVQLINGPLSGLMAYQSFKAFMKGRILWGIFTGMFALTNLAIFTGLVKEK